MKRTLLYSLLLLALTACQDYITPEVPKDDLSSWMNEEGLVKGEVYVKFKQLDKDLQVVATRSGEVETGNKDLDVAAVNIKMQQMERLFPAGKYEKRTRKAGLHLWYKVKFDEAVNVGQAVDAFSALDNVACVEPVGKLVPVAVNPPKDTYFGSQWYLHNTGQIGMMEGADIKILDAWELTSGSSDVIVAVIDQIVDFRHMELNQCMWRNDEEDEDGYVDNDGNGYVGDYYGLGVNNNTILSDDKSHGTHVAGIIGASTVTNNYFDPNGIAGIAGGGYPMYNQGVRIMTCDFSYGPAAIKYAADMGAVICNNSYHVGTGQATIQAFQEAVDYFVEYAGCDEDGNQVGPMKGGLVIAAVANDGVEKDAVIPASLNHVISVASVNPRFQKSSFSNYGSWVSISAPGGGGDEVPAEYDWSTWAIWSTVNNNAVKPMVGTSMASPVVAGVAALVVSYLKDKEGGLTAEEVKHRLLQNVTPIAEYNPEYEGMIGTGCVNAYGALTGAMNWPPVVKLVSEGLDIETDKVLYYDEEVNYVFELSDKETDTAGLTYEVDDPAGIFKQTFADGKLTLSLHNKDIQPGSYKVSLSVTDQGVGGEEHLNVQTTTTAFTVRLLPEVHTEASIENTNTELTIGASATFSGKVTARIYDMLGNLVLEQVTNISLSSPGKVDISGLSGGMYVVKLTCNNKTITKNIIKL